MSLYGTIELCSLDDDSSLLGDASDHKKIDEGTDICHDIGNKGLVVFDDRTGTLSTSNPKKAAAKCPICNVDILKADQLNEHLCVTHFGWDKANITKRKNDMFVYECPTCKHKLKWNAISNHFIQEHTRMCKMSAVESTNSAWV